MAPSCRLAEYPDCKLHGCPCGYFGDARKECTCTSAMVTRYQKKLSGPLLDRIDIHVEVPRVDYEKLADNRSGETSADVRKRVTAAREVQRARFADVPRPKGAPPLYTNADMGVTEIREFCQADPAGQSLLRAAMNQLSLSARAYHRVLKLARTIADLAGSEAIQAAHIVEATGQSHLCHNGTSAAVCAPHRWSPSPAGARRGPAG
jgi:magnesium chelatase family protein